MEDRGPDPGIHADIREDEVVGLHGVAIRDPRADLARAPEMCSKVEKGEEHRSRLLHAREPPERPFPEVLLDVSWACAVCNEMHALVLAIVNACPECHTQSQRERFGVGGRAGQGIA